ncbi:hypothetical protein HPB52_021230 [Rhipicephalus sanguineus]|uniref:Uncharacterized protein n=1 Tax=Rhipicephalus sanguineus TaxID=34632 RepID=A0A9D4T1R6_RHISA|nr:hypothetical protein HPB52_021230 [Rhipicephalus sanguineus]
MLKPRTLVKLKTVPSDRAGDTICAYLGDHSSTALHMWPVWAKTFSHAVSPGYLWCSVYLGISSCWWETSSSLFSATPGEICRVVITINPAETPYGGVFEGTDLPCFIFYDSVVAYVQPYKKTIPSCCTIGHRPLACP